MAELPPHQDQLERLRVFRKVHSHAVALVGETVDLGFDLESVPLVESDCPVVALEN